MSSNILSSLKASSSILWLAHTLEATALLAGVTGGIAVYEAMATGNYGLSSLAGIFLAAAIAILSKGIAALIGNAQFGQALSDLIRIGTSASPAIQSPLVVVHTSQPPVVSPVQVPSMLSVSQPQTSNPAQVSFQSDGGTTFHQVQAPIQQAPIVQHPSMDSVPLVNTLPNIPAVSGS